ncbi:MAG: hypothetical protein HYY51_01720 [Candidatus Magasanikbacteria bacterium]|nr:hypothetical protein [Candidatus Magasanikbacteria bacterium]
MNIHLAVSFLQTLGTLLIAVAALKVHHRVLREEKIDRHTFVAMRWEQFFGYVGMVCIVLAFVLDFLLGV